MQQRRFALLMVAQPSYAEEKNQQAIPSSPQLGVLTFCAAPKIQGRAVKGR